MKSIVIKVFSFEIESAVFVFVFSSIFIAYLVVPLGIPPVGSLGFLLKKRGTSANSSDFREFFQCYQSLDFPISIVILHFLEN